jgi:hypothetical protein
VPLNQPMAIERGYTSVGPVFLLKVKKLLAISLFFSEFPAFPADG